MIERRDDVELELARRRRELKDAGIDLDFFDRGPVEFFERADDAGFFAGARGSVEEEVGEVAGLCLDVGDVVSIYCIGTECALHCI